MTSPEMSLRLGTRGSLLARKQSQHVADELQRRHSGLRVELVIIKTSGDAIQDRPLHDVGGKGLFTKEIEQALLDAKVDFAVHSFKDLPVTLPLVDTSSLMFAATPDREDPRDLLVCEKFSKILDLPQNARVGTTSFRRRCQLLALRPDLVIEPVRGNIDTRLGKLRDGQFDAIILAAAGLKRSGLLDPTYMHFMDPGEMLPAGGQGALALQCRADDDRTARTLSVLNHDPTATCVRLERELIARLQGDCQSPIAALATVSDDRIDLRAAVGGAGGKPPVIRARAQGPADRPADVLRDVFQSLSDQGVDALLGRFPG